MITDVQREGKFIRVTTDDVGRNEFVYLADQFQSREALELEISRSVGRESVRKAKIDARVAAVGSTR